jgi:hypothetical protein
MGQTFCQLYRNVKPVAKIRPGLIFPTEYLYLCSAVHFGPDGTTDPLTVHAVYYYEALSIPPGITAYKFHEDLEFARLEALTWLHMPNIVQDLCILCRNFGPGPVLPRWNIYRGEAPAHVVPCQWWDVKDGDPPWPGST